MNDDEKLIAFTHGCLGDDVSCDHVVVPRHLDVRAKLGEFYKIESRMGFTVWLKERFGGRDPYPDELEEIDEVDAT
jgi:hypothetical protein